MMPAILRRNSFPWSGGVTILVQLLLHFVVATATAQIRSNDPGLCESIDIRSVKDLEKMRNCRVIVGHVSIANIGEEIRESEASAASGLMEISDYLIVHRVEMLRSLEQIFPRLTIIRGRELLFGQYSLVVYENRMLLNLGLVSLLRIQRGDIRIESNPMLCFVDTVNWIYLLGNVSQQHFTLKNNKSPHHCPLCSATDYVALTDTRDDDDGSDNPKHCWHLEAPQLKQNGSSSMKCPAFCGLSGCDAYGSCCHRDCLSDCAGGGGNCQLCATMNLNGKCVPSCNVRYYEMDKRRCVLVDECRRNDLIPHAGVCMRECPKNFQLMHDDSNKTLPLSCKELCEGEFIIKTAKDLTGLSDCSVIRGALIIELIDAKESIIEALEFTFASLQEITGFLKVSSSPALVSLHFLRNLHSIRGEQLIDRNYALYVVDNHHLEEIWLRNQNVKILNGRVYFHLNPRLCYNKVMALQSSLSIIQKISVEDASPNSNGERVICGSNVRTLNPIVEDFNATAARIKVEPMSAEDKVMLIGYTHHYKEAPVKNVTMFDGRHGCGRDKWLMDISLDPNVRHIITNLKPNTQYAYFVKTLTMIDYHTQLEAYSPIKYFRTLPSKPGPVARIYYHSLSSSSLSVHWWPPRKSNGIISKYILKVEKVTEAPFNFTNRNYNANALKSKKIEGELDSCQCALPPEAELSGPPPDAENYYNKIQITYDDALNNLVYVSRAEGVKSYYSNRRERNNTSSDTEEDQSINNSTAGQRERRKTPDVDGDSNSANDIDKSVKNSENYEDIKHKGELKLLDYQRAREQKALEEQDTGTKDFPILKPSPICQIMNASVQYQLENSCKVLEHFKGIKIQGHLHSYTLTNLAPEVTYRISVRPCVAGLGNGCGIETTILAETVSKGMDSVLREWGSFF